MGNVRRLKKKMLIAKFRRRWWMRGIAKKVTGDYPLVVVVEKVKKAVSKTMRRAMRVRSQKESE